MEEVRGLQLISFKDEQIKDLLKNFKFQIEIRGDKEVILNDIGQVAKCKICEKELSVDNIGHITHGSVDMVCDNPACIVCSLVSKNY